MMRRMSRVAPIIRTFALGIVIAAGPGSSGTATGAPSANLLGLLDTGEIYSSDHGGGLWSALASLPVRDAVALHAGASPVDLFLASRSGSIYRSPDGGVSWLGVGAIPASDVEDLVLLSDGTLLALTGTGAVYGSVDLGESFRVLASVDGEGFVSLARSDSLGALYALSRTGEVYRSADGGSTWEAASTIPVSDAIRILAMGSLLWVLTEAGDIAMSADAGAGWDFVGTLSQVGMRDLATNGVSLFAATKEGHVASSDDGARWTWLGSMNQLSLTALATDVPAMTTVGGGAPGAGLRVLESLFPNPSPDGSATFAVQLERDAEVRLEIFDAAGRLVARRPAEALPAGRHALTWRPDGVASGVYFARLVAGRESATRRWVVARR